MSSCVNVNEEDTSISMEDLNFGLNASAYEIHIFADSDFTDSWLAKSSETDCQMKTQSRCGAGYEAPKTQGRFSQSTVTVMTFDSPSSSRSSIHQNQNPRIGLVCEHTQNISRCDPLCCNSTQTSHRRCSPAPAEMGQVVSVNKVESVTTSQPTTTKVFNPARERGSNHKERHGARKQCVLRDEIDFRIEKRLRRCIPKEITKRESTATAVNSCNLPYAQYFNYNRKPLGLARKSCVKQPCDEPSLMQFSGTIRGTINYEQNEARFSLECDHNSTLQFSATSKRDVPPNMPVRRKSIGNTTSDWQLQVVQTRGTKAKEVALAAGSLRFLRSAMTPLVRRCRRQDNSRNRATC